MKSSALNFIAIDVETANADMASICQIGLVKCENGQLTDEWKTYVNPEDYFDEINVSIHGIDEATVEGAPTLVDLHDTLQSYLSGKVVVSHTHFDRVAIHQSAHKYNITVPECFWFDSARIARRAWQWCAWRGYGLSSVCDMLGYQFRHHDALEDAKAAAHIVLAASDQCGLDIDGWLKRVKEPIVPGSSRSAIAIRRHGNPEGSFFGEVLVFTGTLGMPRREAADLAAAIGCQVVSASMITSKPASGVTKKTTMLVVGDQDIRRLAGQEKSSKQRKAEKLVAEGTSIRILKESDFKELVRFSSVNEMGTF